MIDLRCPSCNRPVKGREEVVHRKQLPKVTECPHCKTPVIVERHEDDLGECFSYKPTEENHAA